MLIDLESMFRADFRQVDSSQPVSQADSALANSVLRVGLLPQRQWNGDQSESLELSGMGGAEGQLSLRRLPLWQSGGTDQMRLVRQRVKVVPAINRPSLRGERVNPLDFSQEFQEGFTSMYRLLLRHKAELLAEEGPISRFANDEVRVICRHTIFYKMLLDESYHPDLLRNALDRDRIFDRLWFGADRDPSAQKAVLLIPSERRDLWAGDIPFFSTRVNSHDLLNSHDQVVPLFLQETGFEAVHKRLTSLSEEDLKQQRWFIQGSLTTLAMDTEPRRRRHPLHRQPIAVGRKELLGAACQVGDRLEQLALRGEGDASWIGLRIIGGKHWALSATGLDLYSGLPGIVLFLAYLGIVSGEARYTRLAEEAVASMRTQLASPKFHPNLVGAFEGWSGVLYVYLHLAALWKRGDLIIEAEKILQMIPPLVSTDEALDVVGGSAGAIAVLLAAPMSNGSILPIDIAKRLGDRLIEKAQAIGDGAGWTVLINPERPLTGFSHGASGIAWALLRLYEVTGKEEFKQTARRALSFERRLFSPVAKNWPDLRGSAVDQGEPKFMTAWCHGAPGVGLSRLRMRRLLDDPVLDEDLAAALETTLRHGFGSNHSLCHGDLGNLELFLEAHLASGGESLAQSLSHLTSQIFLSIQENGCISGVPLGVETPGLMNGLAGIGYGLLRLVEPRYVPSVLLLDPPVH